MMRKPLGNISALRFEMSAREICARESQAVVIESQSQLAGETMMDCLDEDDDDGKNSGGYRQPESVGYGALANQALALASLWVY